MTDRPSSEPAQQGSAESPERPASATGPAPQPPGLGEQLGRTKNAALGLVAAHIDLAKAEFSEIIGEVKRAVAFGSVALGLVFVALTILTVGCVLWADEAMFGSMGWGVLHGTEIFLALAVIFVLAIFANGAGRIVGGLVLALVVAAIVYAVLALDLTSQALGWVGDQAFSGLVNPVNGNAVATADRPIWVGVIIVGGVFGILGLLVGVFIGQGFGRLITAILFGIVGLIIGAGVGAFLGVPMSWVCALAVAVAVWLLLWPVFAAWFVLSALDREKLRSRFMPEQTIETTKETIEWVRAQTPLGRKS